MNGWLYRVVLPARRRRAYRRALRRQQQLCKVCGRAQDEVDFAVSDRAWDAVVPARWHGRAVCLSCFDRFATERGLHIVKVFLVNGP
jgi:hypothetical protein